jgi:hypothetical protein
MVPVKEMSFATAVFAARAAVMIKTHHHGYHLFSLPRPGAHCAAADYGVPSIPWQLVRTFCGIQILLAHGSCRGPFIVCQDVYGLPCGDIKARVDRILRPPAIGS